MLSKVGSDTSSRTCSSRTITARFFTSPHTVGPQAVKLPLSQTRLRCRYIRAISSSLAARLYCHAAELALRHQSQHRP